VVVVIPPEYDRRGVGECVALQDVQVSHVPLRVQAELKLGCVHACSKLGRSFIGETPSLSYAWHFYDFMPVIRPPVGLPPQQSCLLTFRSAPSEQLGLSLANAGHC
jgi:hypothetical protein